MSSSLSKINTIFAVFRVPVTVNHLYDIVPSLWSVLLEALLVRLHQLGVAEKPWQAPPSGLESIRSVVLKLEEITGVSLDHLDLPGILHQQPDVVDDLVDLFWELFKTVEASSSGPAGHSIAPLPSHAEASFIQNLPDFEESLLVQEDPPDMDVSADIQSIVDTNPSSKGKEAVENGADPAPSVSDDSFHSSQRRQIPKLNLSVHEIQELGLGPIGESRGRGYRPRSTSPVKKKKQLRFHIREKKGKPTVGQDDFESPRLRVLRLKKHSIQKQQVRPRVDPDRAKIDSLIQQHKDITAMSWKPPGTSRGRTAGIQSEPDELSMLEAASDDWGESLSSIMGQDIPDGSFLPDSRVAVGGMASSKESQTEKNLNAFMNQVSRTIPLTRPFPVTERERAWKAQLKLSRKALDDRIWSQKVSMQRALERIQNQAPMDSFVKEMATNHRVYQQKHETRRLQQATNALQDRYRKIRQLTKEHEALQAEAKRQLQKQNLIEQDLSRGLVDEYMKEQRKLIIAERKADRDLQLARDKTQRDKEAALQAQLLEQIAMVKEEIETAEREERLIRQGEQEVMRSLVRDAKKTQRQHIAQIKEALATDWRLDEYRQQTAAGLQVRFSVQDKDPLTDIQYYESQEAGDSKEAQLDDGGESEGEGQGDYNDDEDENGGVEDAMQAGEEDGEGSRRTRTRREVQYDEMEQEFTETQKDSLYGKNNHLPSAAREGMKRARDMTDDGFNQLYQLKLKEIEAEEELVRQGSHPDYGKRLTALEEKKQRNLLRAKERLLYTKKNVKNTLDAETQSANETLYACTRDRYNLQEAFKNPYDADSGTAAVFSS
ncbi:hypothetical protein HDV03_001886 [Kappamyces sp. JEL0829]|nr:hypothetical protein HDV03_001886 [Kappamyces sp. JEL0829]